MNTYRINHPAPPQLEAVRQQLRRVAAPRRTLSDRARWCLSVAAGVGLVVLELLGGVRV